MLIKVPIDERILKQEANWQISLYLAEVLLSLNFVTLTEVIVVKKLENSQTLMMADTLKLLKNAKFVYSF